jgi:hypothetical protein
MLIIDERLGRRYTQTLAPPARAGVNADSLNLICENLRVSASHFYFR